MVLIGQPLEGEPKGFYRAFQTLKQVHDHESLQALLAVALFELTRAPLDLGVV